MVSLEKGFPLLGKELREFIMTEEVFQKGYTIVNEDILVDGNLEKYKYLASGLSIATISGEERFDLEKNRQETKGRFLLYNPNYYQVLNKKDYDKKRKNGEISIAETIFYGNIALCNNGTRINNEIKVALVSLGKK